MEPPFRIVARALLKRLKLATTTRALWDISRRPPYLLGLRAAAEQAQTQRLSAMSAIEFGVAGGSGLVALQEEAAAVEKDSGIEIRVYGFDMGSSGLPSFIGDHRDHPDVWQPGDYPMDEAALRMRLQPRTELFIGNVRECVDTFLDKRASPPSGFISFDLDLYSSTRDAMRLLSDPRRQMLWHVPLYFDDIDFIFNYRWAGELLAIDEFNAEHTDVKIDHWHGVKVGRPFPERSYLDKLYVAHDLAELSKVALKRPASTLPLKF